MNTTFAASFLAMRLWGVNVDMYMETFKSIMVLLTLAVIFVAVAVTAFRFFKNIDEFKFQDRLWLIAVCCALIFVLR